MLRARMPRWLRSPAQAARAHTRPQPVRPDTEHRWTGYEARHPLAALLRWAYPTSSNRPASTRVPASTEAP